MAWWEGRRKGHRGSGKRRVVQKPQDVIRCCELCGEDVVRHGMCSNHIAEIYGKNYND